MLSPQAPIDQLQQRIADQEEQLHSTTQTAQRLQIFASIVDAMDTGLYIWQLVKPGDPSWIVAVDGNAAAARFMGIDLREHVGKRIHEVFPGALESGMPQLFTQIITEGVPRNLGEQPYKDDIIEGVFTITALPFSGGYLAVLFENITERKRMERLAEIAARQEEHIQAQQATLDELSLPFIPITDHIVVMPLVGMIDSRRARSAIETLLSGVARSRATIVILDVTGVPIVDTQVANALIGAANALRLLGAKIMITGIRPEVAQTLVGLGVDLNRLATPGTLQSAIAQAFRIDVRS